MTFIAKNKMSNLPDIINQTTTEEFYYSSTLTERKLKITVSAINILLPITAFLGNALIIAVLPKASFLHSPSKLLLGCLASTDPSISTTLYHFLIPHLQFFVEFH